MFCPLKGHPLSCLNYHRGTQDDAFAGTPKSLSEHSKQLRTVFKYNLKVPY